MFGDRMDCPSCSEIIPDDSIFCPECGARQNLSRASNDFAQALGGGIASQSASGVVSGEAVRQERDNSEQGGAPPDLLSQIAQGIAGSNQPAGGQVSDMPNNNPHSLGGMTGVSQSEPTNPMSGYTPLEPLDNPSVSPTDEMVNRIAEAEKEVKNERRNQWLQMNQDTAANVLGSISGELPSHLQQQTPDPAQALMQQTMGVGEEGPAPSLLRRMSEVAVRRVARKRGVAVETPQVKPEGDILNVNVTFIDDGRVLDGPAELANAFQHAISTELALKGIDMSTEITLFRSKDGDVEKVHGRGSAEAEEEEDMFACEMCGGLVKESDNKCPHCGAEFADEEEEEQPAARRGPPGRGGGPPGRGGGPGGPKRGPPGGGPGGPKRGGPPGGGPGGPKRGGPPGGGSGGPKRGGPPGGGPGGPKRGPSGGGPPGGPKRGGPPGGPKRGGPPGGPKRGPPR